MPQESITQHLERAHTEKKEEAKRSEQNIESPFKVSTCYIAKVSSKGRAERGKKKFFMFAVRMQKTDKCKFLYRSVVSTLIANIGFSLGDFILFYQPSAWYTRSVVDVCSIFILIRFAYGRRYSSGVTCIVWKRTPRNGIWNEILFLFFRWIPWRRTVFFLLSNVISANNIVCLCAKRKLSHNHIITTWYLVSIIER